MQRLRTAAPGRDVTLLALGDSLVAGYMVQTGFVEALGESLNGRLSPRRVQICNAGICGDTARGGLTRLPDLLQSPVAIDVFMIEFGINDACLQIPLARFAQALRQCCRDYRARGPKGIVVYVVPPPLLLRDLDEAVEPYRMAVLQVASEEAAVAADPASTWSEGARRLYLEDGVHPSPEGHLLMASAVEAVLLPLL